jgi:anti-sigma B factor antagonist
MTVCIRCRHPDTGSRTGPTQATEIHVQPFHLESITAGADCAVLRIGGEVDVYTAPQLRERVIQLLGYGARHIIADLREVEFLDSTGLGALVGSLKRLREQDGSLKLVTAADKILTIFRLTGLVHVFALHSSFPEAIAGDQHWQAALACEGRSTGEWCREHELL